MPYLMSRGTSLDTRRVNAFGSLALTIILILLLVVGVGAQQTATDPPVTVTLTADGETRELISQAETVGDLLTEHKIAFGDLDRCSVPLSTPLAEGIKLTITRVRSEVITETIPLPFETKEIYSDEYRVGSKITKIKGEPGSKVITYRDYYKDGKRTERVKLDVKLTKPRQELVVLGTRGMTLASRGLFSKSRMMEMVATGYGPSGNGKWGMITATGIRPRYGIVAVDPRVIPLGTRLYVEGYGYALAADTGGAIKGKRIDLFYPSDRDAMRVGRKKVRVLILNGNGRR